MTKRTARQTIVFPKSEAEKEPHAIYWVIDNPKIAKREHLPVGTVVIGAMFAQSPSDTKTQYMRNPMRLGYGLSHEALHTALANTLGEELASSKLDYGPIMQFPILARHGFAPLEMVNKRLKK